MASIGSQRSEVSNATGLDCASSVSTSDSIARQNGASSWRIFTGVMARTAACTAGSGGSAAKSEGSTSR